MFHLAVHFTITHQVGETRLKQFYENKVAAIGSDRVVGIKRNYFVLQTANKYDRSLVQIQIGRHVEVKVKPNSGIHNGHYGKK